MLRTMVIVASMLGIAGSTHAQDANPSPYTSLELQPGVFNSVDVAGPFQAYVFVKDGPAQVRLMGPPALLADTLATVEDGKLTIRFREGARWSWNPGSGVNVTVVMPTIATVRSRGAARIDLFQVHGPAVSAGTDGSGSIALHDIDVGSAQFATGGSGDITAEGRARDATYAVGGSGSVDAKRLRVESATIAVGGSGSIYADVSRAANVSVGGSGHVDVVGGGTCTKKSTLPSQIECR